jgi:hypothetical protein
MDHQCEAGVPDRTNPRHACKYRNHKCGRAVGETSADLVGSERDRRHPRRCARSGPLSGVSCGPRAYRVWVPIRSGKLGYTLTARY